MKAKKHWRNKNAAERRRHLAKNVKKIDRQFVLLARGLRYRVKKMKQNGEWTRPR